MRDWMNISEGISRWTVDPDLEKNEQEMVSKFSGYSREMKHYSTKEKRLLRDETHIEKISSAFLKAPASFSLYFWQSPNPDYDLTAFQGKVDNEWLLKRLGESATAAILKQTNTDDITIVFTNNLSDEHKVSLESPWIIAHRIAHSLVGDSLTEESQRIISLFQQFLQNILVEGYGCKWPDYETNPYADVLEQEYHEIYGKLMGWTIGSMKSAREKTITSHYEWWFETIAQYIMTGKITFRTLPDYFDEGLEMTKDPAKRKIVLRAWATFPQRLERAANRLFEKSKGSIFVE